MIKKPCLVNTTLQSYNILVLYSIHSLWIGVNYFVMFKVPGFWLS